MANGRIGKVQILGTLGTGANSTILHVRRSEDSRQYALKVVPIGDKDDLKYLEQARHEFRVAHMLDHSALIKIYQLEVQRDWLFRIRKGLLLLEYVNGKTVDNVKGLTLPRQLRLFERVAAGLVHMHRRGVYHADLKPNNILLSRTGEVKVIDYGLAWVKGEAKGRVQGTPEYMAPEQVKQKVVNERTDIYNFGATMYRLVTWRLPPNCAATGDLPMNSKAFAALLKPVQELMPDTPQPLCDLIHRCLSYKAADRPERMSDVYTVLQELVEKHSAGTDDQLEAMNW